MRIISHDGEFAWLSGTVVPIEVSKRTIEALHPIHAAILQNIWAFKPQNLPEEHELVAVTEIKENEEEGEYWQCSSFSNRVYLEVGMLHICRPEISIWICEIDSQGSHFKEDLTSFSVERMHACITQTEEAGDVAAYIRMALHRGKNARLEQACRLKNKFIADARAQQKRAIGLSLIEV